MNKRFGLLLTAVLCSFPAIMRAEPPQNPIGANHSKDLVVLVNDKLVPCQAHMYDRAAYIVLYFGAGWCPDCRKFSPALVAAYDHQPAAAKRFEVLLVSQDKTAGGMLNFMSTEKMHWPALAFDKIASAEDLNRFFSGHGIPCLTVIDRTGRIVLQSKDDQDGNEILGQLRELVGGRLKK
jgi:thiol-disulfide isomerase/thioredoxin